LEDVGSIPTTATYKDGDPMDRDKLTHVAVSALSGSLCLAAVGTLISNDETILWMAGLGFLLGGYCGWLAANENTGGG
jgi:hypothetical protein